MGTANRSCAVCLLLGRYYAGLLKGVQYLQMGNENGDA